MDVFQNTGKQETSRFQVKYPARHHRRAEVMEINIMESKDFLFCFSFFLLTTDDVIFLYLSGHFYKFQEITKVLSGLTIYFI